MELTEKQHGWKGPPSHVLPSSIYHWALYHSTQNAKTAIILATIFHEKMQCYVLLAQNYIPVTLLRSSDIEMRKLNPKGCGSLNESLWGSRGASGGKRVQRP